MSNPVQPVPEGYHTLTPYLCVHDAAAAIAFYKEALGAIEMFRMADPKTGRIGHSEIQIGDSKVMLADEFPEMGFLSPKTRGGSSVMLYVYVEDVDACVAKAVAAGGKLVKPIQDQFYGDRSGSVEDPFGYHWWIATHKEDVEPEELKKRAEAAFAGGG